MGTSAIAIYRLRGYPAAEVQTALRMGWVHLVGPQSTGTGSRFLGNTGRHENFGLSFRLLSRIELDTLVRS